jgi:hypothetical protein
MPGAIFGLPGPRSSRRNKDKESHDNGVRSFGVVYVNDLAREAVSAEPPIQFPRGSIIVREKLAQADDTQPQHLTVMIKRARRFNPAANDWEFLAIDGAMTKVEARQKKGACLNCHISQKTRDFVYREPPQ